MSEPHSRTTVWTRNLPSIGRPCALFQPAPAARRPREKMAPRWVLMPPVACNMVRSACRPRPRSRWKGAPLSPSSAVAPK